MARDGEPDDGPGNEPERLPPPAPTSESVEKGGKPVDYETRERDRD